MVTWPKDLSKKMTKKAFLKTLQTLYRVGNVSDHESNPNDWTKPDMAGHVCCQHIDKMLRDMKNAGIISDYEHQYFYDSL